MLKKTLILLLFVASYMGIATAATSLDLKREANRAMSLLEHGRYSEAHHSLSLLRQRVPATDDAMVRYVDYGLVRCAAELRDHNAEPMMQAFLRRYPESVYVNEIYMLLAMHYCETEEFAKARTYLKKVPYESLKDEQREMYNMRMGYVEFISGDHDSAYSYFSKLSSNGKYGDHSVYYKSYIHYTRGELSVAKEGFESLKTSVHYAQIVPFYILQIEFANGNYNYVVTNGDELLKNSAKLEYIEVSRIIAESWYRLANYKKAYDYISIYKRAGGNMGREELYLLGYSAYRSTRYEVAIEALKELAGGKDTMAQYASYYLGASYLKKDDSEKAKSAFAVAYESKADPKITKDAHFQYGHLLYKLGGGTFNECINILSSYIQNYPDSERNGDVQDMLIAAYFTSKDYIKALDAINKLPNPDSQQLAAKQHILVLWGMDAFENNDFDKAEAVFKEAEQIRVSPKYRILSNFWLGEIEYKRGNYDNAIKYFDYYVRCAPAEENEYKKALYNLGYAHFVKQPNNLSKSDAYFKEFIRLHSAKDGYRADAFNRRGDIAYAQRRYAQAVDCYNEAKKIEVDEKYYAQFKHAVALGFAKGKNEKVAALQQLKNEDCKDFNDDILYELGYTLVSQTKYKEAADIFEEFVDKYTISPYYTSALLNLGLVHINIGNKEKSLMYYDRVITKDPRSQAAKDANRSVREIYILDGKDKEYYAYAERCGIEGDLSIMARDSLSYRAAQNIYLADRTQDAIQKFKNYLIDYPKGYYTNDVLFCLSDCYMKVNDSENAIATLKQLCDKSTNDYTITAAEMLADLTFANNMYDDAAAAYRLLYDVSDRKSVRTDAATKYAESVILSGNNEKLLEMSQDVENMEDVNPSTLRKVRFSKANVYVAQERVAEAYAIYKELSADVSDAAGAESAYRIIEDTFAKGNYLECENLVYDMAGTPHSYWLAKAFIVLGDVFVKRNEKFQARATYRSIVDGYTPADDGIVAETLSRIDELDKAEAAAKLAQENPNANSSENVEVPVQDKQDSLIQNRPDSLIQNRPDSLIQSRPDSLIQNKIDTLIQK